MLTENAVNNINNTAGTFHLGKEKKKQLVTALESMNKGCQAVSQYFDSEGIGPYEIIMMTGATVANAIANIFK